MTKSEKIKASILKTKEKRKFQDCKVFEVKFDKSHLSRSKTRYLNMLFVEAKWVYNFQLSQDDILNCSYKLKEVDVLNKNKEKEKRRIVHLSSQMVQGIVYRTRQNILNLSKARDACCKIGQLKFKSQVNSIPLKQFNNTYKIESKNYIKLQGFKGRFKVAGLSQLPDGCDIANAVLIKRRNDFYIKIVCFVAKRKRKDTCAVIGLDFGIKDSIVDSNGNKYVFQFPETKQLKKISKKLSRSKKGSKNNYKLKMKLSKQYDNIVNKKKDCKNKYVSGLVRDNDVICIQDEMIAQWHMSKMRGFGRRIQHGISGWIISDLKKKSETLVIPRSFPSTQLCPVCNKLNKFGLGVRVYSCDCGYSCDRDIHGARNILYEGLRQIGRGPINTMPFEANFIHDINIMQGLSVIKEAQCLNIG